MIKIIYITSSPQSLAILENLTNPKEKNLIIQAIVTSPQKTFSKNQESKIETFAKSKTIPLFAPDQIGDITDRIKEFGPDLIFVSNYRQKIPNEILAIPNHGCLNLHFSLLPKYRGPSPVQFAILNGETETGISIFVMDKDFDTGLLLFQKSFPIQKDETSGSLIQKLYSESAEITPRVIKKYLAGKIRPWKQADSPVSYSKYLKREDGKVNLRKNPEKILQKIRAFAPWPGVWSVWRGKRLKILAAHLDQDKRLALDQVQLEGKKVLEFKEFVRGYPNFKIEELE